MRNKPRNFKRKLMMNIKFICKIYLKLSCMHLSRIRLHNDLRCLQYLDDFAIFDKQDP